MCLRILSFPFGGSNCRVPQGKPGCTVAKLMSSAGQMWKCWDLNRSEALSVLLVHCEDHAFLTLEVSVLQIGRG